MKVQECILLIFAAISFLPAPIAADNFQAFDPFNWQTSDNDSPGSLSTNNRKCTPINSEEDECCTCNNNCYQFTVYDAQNQEVCLDKYVGKVLIIVNYASACGFTKINMCSLSELAKKYKECGLKVLVFPSNDFKQNIGGDHAARDLARDYPEFEVFSEIHVNGQAQHPLYRFLKNKLPGICGTKSIKWNFTKFVVDRNGCPIQRYSAKDSFKDIEKLVQELSMDQSCKCHD